MARGVPARSWADVPGAHPRARRPGRRHRGRAAVGRGLRRGPPRAGVPELRLGAHRRAGRGVLPHRRPARSALREPIAEPDALIVQDPTLLHQVDVFAGLGPDGYVLDQHRADASRSSAWPSSSRRFRPERLLTVPATELAREHLGRPLPNAALLGGFAALTGVVSLDSVAAAIRERFAGRDRRRQRRRGRGGLRARASRDRGAEPCVGRLEGSQAVAEAVALCRPEVICAYPISPQTHIVEALSDLVRTGELAPCEYLMVESEFAAMSAAIGASATGARAYTATASQGLLYMAEALYNASGLGPADRDDGREPRDRRADQHLERPQRLDVAARLAAGSSSTRSRTRRRSTSTSRRSAWPRSSRCR